MNKVTCAFDLGENGQQGWPRVRQII